MRFPGSFPFRGPDFLVSVSVRFHYVSKIGMMALVCLAQWIEASACGLKGPGFDSGQGHMPQLQAQSPLGGVQEAANQ